MTWEAGVDTTVTEEEEGREDIPLILQLAGNIYGTHRQHSPSMDIFLLLKVRILSGEEQDVHADVQRRHQGREEEERRG